MAQLGLSSEQQAMFDTVDGALLSCGERPVDAVLDELGSPRCSAKAAT